MRIATGARRVRNATRVSARGARYPSAGAPSTQAKNPLRTPVPCTDSPASAASHLGLERARHADAVLVLQAPVVRGQLGKRPVGEEVVLVGREHEAMAERVDVARLPPLDRVEIGRGFGRGVRPQLGLAVVRAHTERHDTERREPREPVEHAEQRVVEHRDRR